jgi:hypothetical protein
MGMKEQSGVAWLFSVRALCMSLITSQTSAIPVLRYGNLEKHSNMSNNFVLPLEDNVSGRILNAQRGTN